MPSARDFVTGALRLLNIVGAEATPSDAQLQVGYNALNEWMDDLATQRLSIHSLLRTYFPLLAGMQSYTIGMPGGQIQIVRPVWISYARLVINTGTTPQTEMPISIFSETEYMSVRQKGLSSSLPRGIYYDYDWQCQGLARIWLFPVPNVNTLALVLYTPIALTGFQDVSTQYTFPPAYKRMIRYNLAMEIAPYFEKEAPMSVQRIAAQSMGNVKRANMRMREMNFDPAVVGFTPPWSAYDIYADTYR